MTAKSKLSASNCGSISRKELGFFAIAILAIVVLSVAGYTVFAADSSHENDTEADSVYFVENGFKYKVLSESEKRVGVAPYDYKGDVTVSGTVEHGGVTYNVTEILPLAFHNSSITSIAIPASISCIDSTSFLECSVLKSITVVEGNGHFSSDTLGVLYNKDKTVLLKFPEAIEAGETGEYYVAGVVNTIAPYAFSGDVQKTKINLDAPVVKIDDKAFYNYIKLKSVEAKDNSGLDYIGDYAFHGCENLSSVDLSSSSLRTIGKYAFADLESLATMKLPATTSTISEGAFQNCVKLEGIFGIPRDVSSIDGSAFMGCTGITDFAVDKDNQMFKTVTTKVDSKDHNVLYSKSNEIVVFPGGIDPPTGDLIKLNGCTTGIRPYAFSSCTKLFSIDISDCSGMSEIGDHAFYGSAINVIQCGWDKRHIVKVGDYAFYGCKDLHDLEVRDWEFQSIGEYAFFGCEKFYCFGKEEVPDEFTIPSSTNRIAETAFIGCTAIQKFRITNNSVYKVDNGVLYTNDMSRLIAYPAGKTATSFTIPTQTKQLNPCAFVGVKNLTAINVADEHTEFCSVDGVLYNKAKTTLLQYPMGKTNMEYTVLDSTTTIGDFSFAFTNVQKVNSSSVETIGAYAFYYCSELNYANISTAKHIGQYAFAECAKLGEGQSKAIVLNPLVELGTRAFQNCNGVENIIMLSVEPVSLEMDPFYGCNNNDGLWFFVPNYCVDKYKSDDNYQNAKYHIYSLVSEPTPSTSLVYNAKEQTGFTDDKFTITGNTKINAGTYIATVTPNFDEGYVWDLDLHHEVRNVTWTINKLTLEYGDVYGVTTKQYDGTRTVYGEPKIDFSNVPVGGTTPVVDYDSAVFYYDSKDAGTNAINVVNIKLTADTSNNNYQLSASEFTSSKRFNIEQCKLTVSDKKFDFNGEQTFVIEDYATGVFQEKISLVYTTTDYIPGIYVWGEKENGFTIEYASPDGKKNYDFASVDYIIIDTQEITVKFDPDYPGQQSISVNVSWVKGGYMIDRSDLPTIPGQVNLGWYDAEGNLVDFNDYFLEDGAVFKAKWQEASSDMVISSPNSNIVDMDLSGQTSVETVKVNFKNATVILNVKGISNLGAITISVDNAASNANEFKLTVDSKDGWFKDALTVTVPYEVRESYTPVLYHYVGHEKVDMKGTVDEANKVITFSTIAYNGDQYGVEYVQTPTPVPPTPTPTPSNDDNTAIIIAVIVILAILIGAGVYFYAKKH